MDSTPPPAVPSRRAMSCLLRARGPHGAASRSEGTQDTEEGLLCVIPGTGWPGLLASRNKAIFILEKRQEQTDTQLRVLCRAWHQAGVTQSLPRAPGTACPAPPHPSVGCPSQAWAAPGTALCGVRVRVKCQEPGEDSEPPRSSGSNGAAAWTQPPSFLPTALGLSWVPQTRGLGLRS